MNSGKKNHYRCIFWNYIAIIFFHYDPNTLLIVFILSRIVNMIYKSTYAAIAESTNKF